jgi:putative phosphoribosyl transferase
MNHDMPLKNIVLQGRRQAGHLLSQKLSEYKDSSAIILAASRGGIKIGYYLARALNLPLEVSLCRKINHPGNNTKAIGYVSQDDVVLHGNAHGIPQDYIYHQVTFLRQEVARDCAFYYGDTPLPSFFHKTVILVDDFLKESDAMLACVRSIKKQQPLRIIVAAPGATPEAGRAISAEADHTVFLCLKPSIDLAKSYLNEFQSSDNNVVQGLFIRSKKNFLAADKVATTRPDRMIPNTAGRFLTTL